MNLFWDEGSSWSSSDHEFVDVRCIYFLLCVIGAVPHFQGRVNLKKPDHKFFVMETDDYGCNNGLPPVAQRTVFFGREVGAADRHLLPTYQLKSRKYIGPTAMDAEMAFLMANQGLARPGKLVYDPFVGTGSILVAAAHFGAMTMVCAYCADNK